MKPKNIFKLCIGIIISSLFLYLAFRNVEFTLMINAIKNIKYIQLIFIFITMFFYEWIRAWRWKYLMIPIKEIETTKLFSALMIGYSANIIVPAHFGEFARAYVIGKRSNISVSSAFATIVTERILDIFSLLFIMGITLFIYPFPGWAKKSGLILLVITSGIILVFFLLKRKKNQAQKFLFIILKPLPHKIKTKIISMVINFLDGFVGMKNWKHYLMLLILTIAIWGLYVLSFLFGFLAFNFRLPIITSLILVIFTTISIVIPSSPGYIGAYHWTCQLGLGLFGISKSLGIGFALVFHGILTIPFFFIGLLFAWNEGFSISKMIDPIKVNKQKPNDSNGICLNN